MQHFTELLVFSCLDVQLGTVNKTPPTYKIQNIMDIFSLGCVISEVILNGKITFNYELLLKYKKEEETINEILD